MSKDAMRLKRKLPRDRTFEQLRNHYEVEKSIAARLKNAGREERKKLFPVMYDELFAKVPDHPRNKARKSADEIESLNKKKLQLVEEHLDDSTIFVEFGPGDCHFAFEVCKHVKMLFAVDISDQRAEKINIPANFNPHSALMRSVFFELFHPEMDVIIPLIIEIFRQTQKAEKLFL